MPLIWQHNRHEKSRVRKAFFDIRYRSGRSQKLEDGSLPYLFLSTIMQKEEMGRGISNYYTADRAKRRVKNTSHNIMKVTTIRDTAIDQEIYNVSLNHCEGRRPKVFPPFRFYLTKRFRGNLWGLKTWSEKLSRDCSGSSNILNIIYRQAFYKRIKW